MGCLRFYIFWSGLGVCLSLLLTAQGKTARSKVLLLSFDGFRWDYFTHFSLPNFEYLADTGVSAKSGVETAFITKTFPDHYTIVTGLFTEAHGIIANYMYDPKFNETFNFSTLDPKWWDGGEPIWITSKLQGLRSGVYFWPGGTVVLKNTAADYRPIYNDSVPFKTRIDGVVDWIVNDKVDIALAYIHQPDSAGHQGGAFSEILRTALLEVDEVLGYLINKLRENGILDSTNLIVVSDHGMTNVSFSNQTIILSDYNVTDDIDRISDYGPLTGIFPKDGKTDDILQKLKNIDPHVNCYRKENFPKRYHYNNHRRIPPILVLADEGYFVVPNRDKIVNSTIGGQHGYDNTLSSMKPIFFARGPDFKKNYKTESFETVNIYPLVCHLLGIIPASNNGSLDNVRHLLNSGTSVNICLSAILIQIVVTLFRQE